jgi:hypothetical protein
MVQPNGPEQLPPPALVMQSARMPRPLPNLMS